MSIFSATFCRNEIADLESGLRECKRLRHNAPFIRMPKKKLAEQLAELDHMIATYEGWIAEWRGRLELRLVEQADAA